MTKTIDIAKAKTQLPRLLSLALKGNEVIITEGKKQLAKIIPASSSPKTRIAGLNRGKIWISNDFDEPLLFIKGDYPEVARLLRAAKKRLQEFGA